MSNPSVLALVRTVADAVRTAIHADADAADAAIADTVAADAAVRAAYVNYTGDNSLFAREVRTAAAHRCANRIDAACAKARAALAARGLSNEAIDLEIQAAVMRLFDDDARA